MMSLGGVRTVVATDTAPKAIVPEPRDIEPLLNAMVPVTPEGTDAVIVTESPYVLAPEVVTVTVVVALLTTWTITFEVSVPNFAVILWEPPARVEIIRVAVVPDMAPVPMVVAPSRKVTEPVVPDGTVAVKVTDCVYVDGLVEELSTMFETVVVTEVEVLEL
jgi:hypothetical protein